MNKEIVIQVCFTVKEAAKLIKEAREAEMKKSAYIRDLVKTHPKRKA